jgi:WD40 repeat protein
MIDVCDAATGKRHFTLAGHRAPVCAVEFSSDGRTLLSSSYDGTWKLWDLPPPASVASLGTHRKLVRDLAFSPSGDALACASFDGSVRIFDVEARQSLAEVSLCDTPVGCVSYGPDGSRLYAGTGDGRIFILGSGGEKLGQLAGRARSIFSVAPDPSGRWLASGQDLSLAVWDLASCREVFWEKETSWVWSVAFSPDGRLLASSGSDGPASRVRLRETGSWRVVRDLVQPGHINAAAFSPDGSILATGAQGGRVRVWDVSTGACRRTMTFVQPAIERVAFSPDGRRLAVAAGRTVQLWDPSTGERLLTFRDVVPNVYAVVFSPDGTRLAAGGGNEGQPCGIRLWGRMGDRPWPPVLRDD